MKKVSNIYILGCCFFLFLLVSCGGSSSSSVKGDGNVIRHEVLVNVYNEIKVEGAFDVIYESKPDEAAFLEVEADDNIIPLVDIRVKGNTLQIKARESINPSRIIVYTNSPSLKYIESKGASNITLKGTVAGDELKVEMKGTGNFKTENIVYDKGEYKLQGAGNISLNGQVRKAKYEITGSGNIVASGLSVSELECNIKGSGDMEVNAIDKMSVDISGRGNILYKGNPQITKQKIKGAGTVKVM